MRVDAAGCNARSMTERNPSRNGAEATHIYRIPVAPQIHPNAIVIAVKTAE